MIEKINSRLRYIDRLKGIAILAVIMGHIEPWSLGWKDNIWGFFISSFHMPLFLFLSGVVISSIPSPQKYVIKLSRFLMPFFIIGTILCVCRGITFSDFIFNELKYGYWYLFVLSIFYLFLTLFKLNKFETRTHHIICDIFIAIFVYVLLQIIMKVIPVEYRGLISGWPLIAFWPCFIFGFMLRKYNLINNIRHNNYVIIMSTVLYLITFNIDFKQLFFLKYYFAIITFLGLFSMRENKCSCVENELERFGRGSLDIYIFHFFSFIFLNLSLVGSWLKNLSGGIFLELILLIILSVAISYICLLIGYILRKSSFLDQIVYGTFAKKLFKEKTEIK